MDASLLERAAPLFRCPACRSDGLSPSGRGLRCGCGHDVPERDGYLDFFGAAAGRLSPGERIFQSEAVSKVYSAARESIVARVMNGKSFADEVALFDHWLELRDDSTLLDVPCGQGNFTAALAGRCPDGIVIGLDLSDAQLRLAAARLERERIGHVVLVRGSALELPIRDGVVDAVVTPGGLHIYPDVQRAVAEMRRVLPEDARVAGLTFARMRDPVSRLAERASRRLSLVRSFDFDELGHTFRENGFDGWEFESHRLIGWFTARAA